MIENTNQSLIYYTKNKFKLLARRIVWKDKEKQWQIWKKQFKIKIIRWKSCYKTKEMFAKIRLIKLKIVYKGLREMLKDLKTRKKTN
jgi:hypothetical protein